MHLSYIGCDLWRTYTHNTLHLYVCMNILYAWFTYKGTISIQMSRQKISHAQLPPAILARHTSNQRLSCRPDVWGTATGKGILGRVQWRNQLILINIKEVALWMRVTQIQSNFSCVNIFLVSLTKYLNHTQIHQKLHMLFVLRHSITIYHHFFGCPLWNEHFRTWNTRIGRGLSFLKRPMFRCRNVSFRECKIKNHP